MNSGNESDDVDVPSLSPWAAAALQEFYNERLAQEDLTTAGGVEISEDWQLSQFWYDDATSNSLAIGTLRLCEAGDMIACVSCPTIYRRLRQILESSNPDQVKVKLLEYDRRFASIAGDDFIYYDYNEPRQLPNDMLNECRVVLADPPFLSEECLTKILETIRLLAKDKVILCTGAVMEETVIENVELNLKPCRFEPRHANNLANEFKCFANYDLDSYVIRDDTSIYRF